MNVALWLHAEPNSYEKKAGIAVDGYQLGRDFLHLREILQESKMYNSSGLYGPDISQPRDHHKDLLTGCVCVRLCLDSFLCKTINTEATIDKSLSAKAHTFHTLFWCQTFHNIQTLPGMLATIVSCQRTSFRQNLLFMPNKMLWKFENVLS